MCAALALLPATAHAQSLASSLATSNSRAGGFSSQPEEIEILGLSVEGVDSESMQRYVLTTSELAVGQTLTLPGDPALAEAIRNLYELRVFSDVKIVEERRAGSGVFLVVRVVEEPKLVDYSFSGIKKKHIKELEKEVPLFKGTRVRPARPGEIGPGYQGVLRRKGLRHG